MEHRTHLIAVHLEKAKLGELMRAHEMIGKELHQRMKDVVTGAHGTLALKYQKHGQHGVTSRYSGGVSNKTLASLFEKLVERRTSSGGGSSSRPTTASTDVECGATQDLCDVPEEDVGKRFKKSPTPVQVSPRFWAKHGQDIGEDASTMKEDCTPE